MSDSVAILNAHDYREESLISGLEAALGALGVVLPRQSRVLIKPNLFAQNYPAQCTVTHPAVIAALCSLLRDRGCSITIGDSSAFYQPGNTRRAFRTSGIEAVAARFGARIVAFEEDGGRVYHKDDNLILHDVLLTRLLEETDCLINVPKLKTHAFFRMSGAVKNLFGLVPGGTKYEYHFIGGYRRTDFGEKLADIASIARPYLTVMDAVMGLEGFGPAATGRPKETGLLLVSRNPFALDCAAARIIGLDPLAVKSTEAGVHRGLVPKDLSIRIVGDYSACPSVPYRLHGESEEEPREKDRLYRLMAVRPRVHKAKCDRCGACVASCPLDAICMVEKAAIDASRCLNCYHCAYSCPRRAIRLRGVWYAPALYALRRIFRL